MNKEKKLKAAIIAVLNYLEEEKQSQMMATTISEPPRQLGNWSNYGRQIMMINRDRMQRRVIKR